jgi:hypothetical protein
VDLWAEQEARLEGVRIEKRVAGEDSLVIPIERAMELLAREAPGAP